MGRDVVPLLGNVAESALDVLEHHEVIAKTVRTRQGRDELHVAERVHDCRIAEAVTPQLDGLVGGLTRGFERMLARAKQRH